jgi:hypothetical protein
MWRGRSIFDEAATGRANRALVTSAFGAGRLQSRLRRAMLAPAASVLTRLAGNSR